MRLMQCVLVENDCYRAGRNITPAGLVLHSTGANNPNLKRYVQPAKGQTVFLGEVRPRPAQLSRTELLALLGENRANNDWNRGGTGACVHVFIGKLDDGSVASVQTLPWKTRPWGCGSGARGSYNNSHIQIEVCEDKLTDRVYFDKVWKESVELCAHLCRSFSIPPEKICSHAEAYRAGYATNHADIDHWLKKHGRSMENFRAWVKKEI